MGEWESAEVLILRSVERGEGSILSVEHERERKISNKDGCDCLIAFCGNRIHSKGCDRSWSLLSPRPIT